MVQRMDAAVRVQKLKNDKDVVLAAVKREGDMLRWASNNLKNDKEVVLAAVNKDPDALRMHPTICRMTRM